jgi:hypothetical protein
MLTPYLLVTKGETAVLIAQSSTVISTTEINWYYKGNALTVNGQVTQSIGKYAVSSNGTVFTLSIQSIKDYGLYSLLYVNLQTIQITVVNATIEELVVTVGKFILKIFINILKFYDPIFSSKISM